MGVLIDKMTASQTAAAFYVLSLLTVINLGLVTICESRAVTISSSVDVIQNGADVIETAADVIESNADVIEAGADVLGTDAEVVESAAAVIEDAADVIEAGADVIENDVDVIREAKAGVLNAEEGESEFGDENVEDLFVSKNVEPNDGDNHPSEFMDFPLDDVEGEGDDDNVIPSDEPSEQQLAMGRLLAQELMSDGVTYTRSGDVIQDTVNDVIRRKRSHASCLDGAFFARFSGPQVRQQGSQTTFLYERSGNHEDAVRDFYLLCPHNVQTAHGRLTGTLKQYQISVPGGADCHNWATLQIRREDGLVLKFRYRPTRQDCMNYDDFHRTFLLH